MSGYALKTLRAGQPKFGGETPSQQPRVIVLRAGSPTTQQDESEPQSGGGSGGNRPPTTFEFPEGEGDDPNDPEFDIGPLPPELARQAHLREQEVEATRDFAKSLVAYWHECLEGEIPANLAATLLREYQQVEMNRLTNIDVHRLRFDNE